MLLRNGLTLTIIFGLCLTVAYAGPVGFVHTNLASDQSSVVNPPNPDLKNAWGLAASGMSPWWLGLNGQPTSSLFFTAGPNGEADGLFGVLAQAPEPGTWVLAGVALLPILRRLRR